tara:strand:- start:1326 stop:1484 length:159 start_codon:yes stop_codon:yes gene_type:complete
MKQNSDSEDKNIQFFEDLALGMNASITKPFAELCNILFSSQLSDALVIEPHH